MLSTILDDIFGPHSKISVLRVLFKNDDLNGREIARRSGLSPRAASQALNHLVRIGIVRRKSVGSNHLFSVNRRRRIVFQHLGNLFAEEEDMAGTIGHEISQAIGHNKCVSVAIFGSYARGESAPRSDLDVLILLDASYRVAKVKDLLEKESGKFYDSFGIRLSPYVVGAAEFADRFKKNDKLIKAIVREGRVIAGKPLAEVLVDESEESISEQEALSYLKKAEEFYLTMIEVYEKRRWNSAGLNGIHCVISASDALLGKKARIRSSGESHFEVVELLKQHIQDSNIGAQSQRLSKILGHKSLVEYESREFHENEAAGVVKDVGRYFEWVKTFFPV